uniref:Uncharacterized protein n=1 Tax=Oryza brachyantha TaxID=4533 RepID=J3MY49_ORYBR
VDCLLRCGRTPRRSPLSLSLSLPCRLPCTGSAGNGDPSGLVPSVPVLGEFENQEWLEMTEVLEAHSLYNRHQIVLKEKIFFA